MTVYANIKRLIFKGFNTIWSLLTEESRPPDSKYFSYEDTSVINGVTIKDKDKCVVYLQNNWSEEDANILCSGNALDNGVTLKNNVMFGYISKENYKNAGLEVTYVDGISITGYNVEGGLDVVIPNTVMSIGKRAFTDNKLTEITILSSVTNIGGYPDNVTSERVFSIIIKSLKIDIIFAYFFLLCKW